MSRPLRPSMPSEAQIEAAFKQAKELMGVTPVIKRIGPDGVEFDYPSDKMHPKWNGKPFAAE